MSQVKITKQYILGQLDENEVDLSMNQLTTVPVRELAQVTRGTKLDLSRNHLKRLPETFGDLNHLVSLDLSSNQLQSLPSSFCRLSALQTLDLYSNQLVNLPPSFYQLKKLKWLDLKNNPLEAGLKEAAGTCASPRECLQCATRVLAYTKYQAARVRQNNQEKQKEEVLRLEEKKRKKLNSKAEKELHMRQREKQAELKQLAMEQIRQHYGRNHSPEPMMTEQDLRGLSSGPWYADFKMARVGYVCSTMILGTVFCMIAILLALVSCDYLLSASTCQNWRLGLVNSLARFLELFGARVD